MKRDIIISTIIGALMMILLSSIQKFIAFQELLLNPLSYIVPIFFGGTAGLVIRLKISLLNAQNQQLQATEQQLRAANQQLTASEAKFKSYIQNAPDGIFIANEKGKYIEVNKAACEITGYSEEELLNLTIPELIQEEYTEKAKNHFQTVVKEEFARGELGFFTKSGEKRFWSVDAVKLSETRFLGFVKDITERKQAEEALLRQERLSAIGELASGVAHDFNNALQIILGGVEMAMVSEEPEELSQYLESIKHSAGDAASRVRQLQRFSQKSQAQKESVPIDINKLAKDVIKETKLFINQYQKKGIHIKVKSDFKAKTKIEGDEGELRASLFNLIKNSAEAMPKGGTITISTDEYDDNVYVSVADTGSGMDKETRKKLFQPFYSTKGFEPGRGLGMTQVYSTIRDHNGDIYIKESEIGKGTVIEFALPLSQKNQFLKRKKRVMSEQQIYSG